MASSLCPTAQLLAATLDASSKAALLVTGAGDVLHKNLSARALFETPDDGNDDARAGVNSLLTFADKPWEDVVKEELGADMELDAGSSPARRRQLLLTAVLLKKGGAELPGTVVKIVEVGRCPCCSDVTYFSATLCVKKQAKKSHYRSSCAPADRLHLRRFFLAVTATALGAIMAKDAINASTRLSDLADLAPISCIAASNDYSTSIADAKLHFSGKGCSQYSVWCPQANCAATPRCEPCKHRFLIEIAAGRSGSTSLMHMIGELPGVRMAGENNDVLGVFHQMLDNYIENPNIHPVNNETSGSWRHGYIYPSDFACPAQSMIRTIVAPSKKEQDSKTFDDSNTIFGFKTIRFLARYSMKDAVDFVKHHFPCSRIVVNINSNATRQSSSAWYRYDPDSAKKIEAMNKRLQEVSKMFGSQGYLLDSSEWGRDGGERLINDFFHWLGFRNCTLLFTYHDNIWSGYEVDDRAISLGPECRLASAHTYLNT